MKLKRFSTVTCQAMVRLREFIAWNIARLAWWLWPYKIMHRNKSTKKEYIVTVRWHRPKKVEVDNEGINSL